jgi:hypothetical protein
MWMDTIPEQGMGACYGATPAIFEAGNYDYVGLQVADCDEPTHQQSADLAMLSMPDLIPRPEAITASLECSAPRKYEIFTHAQADRVYLRPELNEMLAPPIGFVDPEKPESVAPPVTNMYGRSVASQQFYKRPEKPTISNRYVTDADIAFQPVPTDAFPQPAPDVKKVPDKADASTSTDPVADKIITPTPRPAAAGVGAVPTQTPVAIPDNDDDYCDATIFLSTAVSDYDTFIRHYIDYPAVRRLANQQDRLVYLGALYRNDFEPENTTSDEFVGKDAEMRREHAAYVTEMESEGLNEQAISFQLGIYLSQE